jgi:AcrR family transcriptional regulator
MNPPARPPGAEPTKSERTRAAIVEAAMALFRERGYEGTTMRGVAEAAGVSVGNAYYYFASKEHLVQGWYESLAAEHAAAVAAATEGNPELADRLRLALLAWLDVAAPNHEFAGTFFAVAARPGSPLSPFSAESAPARATAIGIMRDVVAGSSVKVDAFLRPVLPELLWLYHLGVVLYWVHDTSPGTTRTRELVERSAPMVATLVRAARWPGLRPLARQVVDLVDALRKQP